MLSASPGGDKSERNRRRGGDEQDDTGEYVHKKPFESTETKLAGRKTASSALDTPIPVVNRKLTPSDYIMSAIKRLDGHQNVPSEVKGEGLQKDDLQSPVIALVSVLQ